ncbi:DUF1403 family protein [Aquamicrobium defluvii]|uniref:DUF1403 family protein n=1 Tax=Aquamicrobium defluvii TaxID=69279 RepID=A0A011T021_9HYPH|nr:DUF1403 family protein [Aquamicrobium defluvii]EXL04914.1 hypothetical protein BG36_09450 [Aquamicrobium defluvii]EZQ14544.1 hypothetical protein CF98_18845 [Halopseudomonas bauzanensis]
MILRHKPSLRHHGNLPGPTAAAPMAVVPAWLRRAVPDTQSLAGKGVGLNALGPNALEDIAIAAGAAIGALDAVVRRQEKWAGAWRQRLALSAAATTARQAGRVEDEAALRDTFVLARPGDILSGSTTLGPGGLLLLAWRRLAARPAEDLLTEKSLGAVLEEFGYARDDEAVSDFSAELRQLSTTNAGTVATLTGAFMAAERHGFGRFVGPWLADALLAQRLGWAHAVPLLGAEAALAGGSGRPRRPAMGSPLAGVETEANRAKNLLAAQARAALRAIDLFTELGRRADRLLAVAPKLRAKGAEAIVDRLLNEDALVASRGEHKTGMSDRGLRRLFDRLVELGTVRELSGRPTFRIYGL